MWMTIGERRFAIILADTEAARAFAALLPLTLDMEELKGNEKKNCQIRCPRTRASPVRYATATFCSGDHEP